MPTGRLRTLDELEELLDRRAKGKGSRVIVPHEPVPEPDSALERAWGRAGDYLTEAVETGLGALERYQWALTERPWRWWERGLVGLLAGPLAGWPAVAVTSVPVEVRRQVPKVLQSLWAPGSAVLAPPMEALRRYRRGEPQQDWGWYLDEFKRQLALVVPGGMEWAGIGEPRTDLFRSFEEVARGRREEPRWWSLLFGFAGSMLPGLVYSPLGFGRGSARGLRTAVRTNARRTGRWLADVAGEEAGARFSRGLIETMEEMAGKRQIVADFIRRARKAGQPVSARDIAWADQAYMQRTAEALLDTARRVGEEFELSPQLTREATRRFMTDLQWEMQPHWRYGPWPLDFWRRPSRGAGPTRWAFTEAAPRATWSEGGTIITVEEPLARPRTAVRYQFYQQSSRTARRIADMAARRASPVSEAVIEVLARGERDRYLAKLRQRIDALRGELFAQQPEDWVPPWVRQPIVPPTWEPTARGALEVEVAPPYAEPEAPVEAEAVVPAERPLLGQMLRPEAEVRLAPPTYEPTAREALAAEPTVKQSTAPPRAPAPMPPAPTEQIPVVPEAEVPVAESAAEPVPAEQAEEEPPQAAEAETLAVEEERPQAPEAKTSAVEEVAARTEAAEILPPATPVVTEARALQLEQASAKELMDIIGRRRTEGLRGRVLEIMQRAPKGSPNRALARQILSELGQALRPRRTTELPPETVGEPEPEAVAAEEEAMASEEERALAEYGEEMAARADEEALRRAELEYLGVVQEAEDVGAAVYEAAIEDGLPPEQAAHLRAQAEAAVYLVHEPIVTAWERLQQAVKYKRQEQEALPEAVAESAAQARPSRYRARVAGAERLPRVERLAQLNEVRRRAIERAWEFLQEQGPAPVPEPPAYRTVEQVADEAASGHPRAVADEVRRIVERHAEPVPGEKPIETVVRTVVEQGGATYKPKLRATVRNADADRLGRLLAGLEVEYETLQQAELPIRELVELATAKRRTSIANAIRQSGEWRERLPELLTKWPGVRVEDRQTLSLIETETAGLRDSLRREVIHHIFGGNLRLRLGRPYSYERVTAMELMEARGLDLPPADQLKVVIEGLRTEHPELGPPEKYLTPEGQIDFDALPPLARRVFHMADWCRRLLDELWTGSLAIGPGLQEMAQALGINLRPRQRYYPQPGMEPIDLSDWSLWEDASVEALLLDTGKYFRELGRALRGKAIVEHRTWEDVPAADRAVIESLERGDLPPSGSIKEPDLLRAMVWYIHQFVAVRTVYKVHEWLREYGDTVDAFLADPELAKVAGRSTDAPIEERNKAIVADLIAAGWGPPMAYDQVLKGAEGYLLPPPIRAALQQVLVRGTAPAILDSRYLRWTRPIQRWVRPLAILPLETISFLATNLWELVGNALALGQTLFDVRDPVGAVRSAAEGFVLANRLLTRDLLAMMDRYPPNSWAQEFQRLSLLARDRLFRLATDRWGVTTEDLDRLLVEMREGNIIGGAVGTHAKEEISRLVRSFGVLEDEARALTDAGLSIVMNIDRFARTWMWITLRLSGYGKREATAVVREWSVSYDEAARTPLFDVLGQWMFYSTWFAERTHQYGSLLYKRPGVWLLMAAAEADKDRYAGVPSPWLGVYGGLPPWQASDLTYVGVTWRATPVRRIGEFLASCKYLEEWDGYYLPYVRVPLPQADWAGDILQWISSPIEVGIEKAVPLVRGMYEAERGGDFGDVVHLMPGVGAWARAEERFTPEVIANLETVLPGIAGSPELPFDVFLAIAREGRTPPRCRVPREHQDAPEEARIQYEAEAMMFQYLLERASRLFMTRIRVRTVPANMRYMTIAQIEHTLDAIEQGADLRRRPSDSPAAFAKALRQGLQARREGRYHPDFAPYPRTSIEQLGGWPAWLSRQLVAPEEEVPAR